MRKINLCTYFDKNYLAKFLTCRNSVLRFEKNAEFYCLCLDTETYNYLNKVKLNNVHLVLLEELESYFLELKYAKKNREKVEFYFTLSPFLPLYILKKYKLDQINYIDSDLYFFDTPQKIIDYLGNNSIIVIEHGIKTKRFGKYNVGWLTFKNDEISKTCLEEWASNCIGWCYDYVEHEKYADQKYLDTWPEKYKKITILPSEYSSAPWNITNKNITINQKKEMFVNKNKLIFFHFHGLNIYQSFFSTGISMYNKRLKRNFVEHIYNKYISELEAIKKKVNFVETNIRQKVNYEELNMSIIVIFKKIIRMFKQFMFIDFYKK